MVGGVTDSLVKDLCDCHSIPCQQRLTRWVGIGTQGSVTPLRLGAMGSVSQAAAAHTASRRLRVEWAFAASLKDGRALSFKWTLPAPAAATVGNRSIFQCSIRALPSAAWQPTSKMNRVRTVRCEKFREYYLGVAVPCALKVVMGIPNSTITVFQVNFII